MVAEASVHADVRTKRCASDMPERHRDGILVRVCQAPRGVGSGRLKCRMDLRKQAVGLAQRKSLRVVPPSSRSGEMAPPSEGTVGRFWSLGETEPHPLQSGGLGEELAVGNGADVPVPGGDRRRQRSERIS